LDDNLPHAKLEFSTIPRLGVRKGGKLAKVGNENTPHKIRPKQFGRLEV